MVGSVSNIVMESFKADYDKIKGKEFKSNRRSNTGIGKTFAFKCELKSIDLKSSTIK